MLSMHQCCGSTKHAGAASAGSSHNGAGGRPRLGVGRRGRRLRLQLQQRLRLAAQRLHQRVALLLALGLRTAPGCLAPKARMQ